MKKIRCYSTVFSLAMRNLLLCLSLFLSTENVFFFLWLLLKFSLLFFVDHFKVFIEFVVNIILLLFQTLVFWSQGMWDLSSWTRGQSCTPAL